MQLLCSSTLASWPDISLSDCVLLMDAWVRLYVHGIYFARDACGMTLSLAAPAWLPQPAVSLSGGCIDRCQGCPHSGAEAALFVQGFIQRQQPAGTCFLPRPLLRLMAAAVWGEKRAATVFQLNLCAVRIRFPCAAKHATARRVHSTARIAAKGSGLTTKRVPFDSCVPPRLQVRTQSFMSTPAADLARSILDAGAGRRTDGNGDRAPAAT